MFTFRKTECVQFHECEGQWHVDPYFNCFKPPYRKTVRRQPLNIYYSSSHTCFLLENVDQIVDSKFDNWSNNPKSNPRKHVNQFSRVKMDSILKTDQKDLSELEKISERLCFCKTRNQGNLGANNLVNFRQIIQGTSPSVYKTESTKHICRKSASVPPSFQVGLHPGWMHRVRRTQSFIREGGYK